MPDVGNILWLASYPKSGNTWMRAFIANLTSGSDDPVSINAFDTGSIASSREWVDGAIDFDINELSHNEIDALRPEVYRWLSLNMSEVEYHKIHDAYTFLPDGTPLVPAAATRASLYIVRNPLDVVVSFAHHSNVSFDKAIENLANSAFSLAAREKHFNNQLRQRLMSWSEHVQSWLEAENMHVKIIRYEDMKQNPLTTFIDAAKFLGLNSDLHAVRQALHHCDIKTLQAQEAKEVFRERPQIAERFFRKGVVGDWETLLTQSQIEKIIAVHGVMMRRLGYLNHRNQPCVFDYLSEGEIGLAR